MPHQLRSQDWRSVVRLVGECRDLGDDATVWREHLFSEVGRLTGASLVVGGETVTRASGMVPLGMAEWGWGNGFDRAVMLQALSVEPLDLTVNPHFAAYLACSGSGRGWPDAPRPRPRSRLGPVGVLPVRPRASRDRPHADLVLAVGQCG